MRLIPSDPDLQTLVARIRSGDIELQPNFQRGEVWSRSKNQKLIDSILRDWHIPPIHVIENKITKRQEVLDGQQRLVAIRDFMNDVYPIDGFTEPADNAIESLNGLRYSNLDEAWQRRINQFAIRVFRLVEYEPGEPWELFFRLNQSTRLTGAEERNAFFGPVRDQIKSAVANLERKGIDSRILGFSNARMAYDDVISRTALAIKRKTLSEKITAADLTHLYRSEVALDDETIHRLDGALTKLSAFEKLPADAIRLNKASVFTWLMFNVRANWTHRDALPEDELAKFIHYFNFVRNESFHSSKTTRDSESIFAGWQIYVFEDRSAARVADTSSVVLRDAILWNFYLTFARKQSTPFPLGIYKAEMLTSIFNEPGELDDDRLARRLIELRWGDLP
jgi:hypothetical protein